MNKIVISLSLLIGSWGCSPEPIVENELLVGNSYLVQTVDGDNLFVWTFEKSGNVTEFNIATSTLTGGGLYEFKWDGGIKTALITTVGLIGFTGESVQQQFAINDDDLSKIYLTNLKDFSIFVLIKQ